MTKIRDVEEISRTRPQDMRNGVVAYGRGGEVLTRSQKSSTDPFAFDHSIVPEGWDYQWNTVSVVGSKDACREEMHTMYSNGWRPVPADRHDGVFLPPGTKGEIVIKGMRLEERPLILSKEAREEELMKAARQMSDRNESFKMAGVNRSLPSGFNPLTGSQQRVLRTGGDNVRISMDASLDAMIPRPKHETPE